MVGDLLVDRVDRRELALLDQPGQQLGVVDDLVVAAELRVLAAMVLKQCGQDAMTFLPVPAPTPASLRVSTFCWASIWKTNSLPSRRAGSPVQASAGPRTANLTPAVCSSSAIALVAFFARSSRAPAQPTQYRYSMSSGIVAVDDGDLEVELGDPVGAAGPRPCPRGCPCARGC